MISLVSSAIHVLKLSFFELLAAFTDPAFMAVPVFRAIDSAYCYLISNRSPKLMSILTVL
jgi:hypothetical protein